MTEAITGGGDPHFLLSTLRERIVEHVFVGELLRRLWQRQQTDIEILRSEFDAGGYDLVVGAGPVLRHIQFKCSRVGGKAAQVSVSLKLAAKPSGCVIWIVVHDDLTFDHFRWFGAAPGERLPEVDGFKVTKHSKGNAQGVKLEKPGHRLIPKGRFETIAELNTLIDRLFGTALAPDEQGSD